MKPTFILPPTPFCRVVWKDREGKIHSTPTMNTPKSSNSLIELMLLNHRVGFSQIRYVESVEIEDLIGNFGRNSR
jgi:hypothetical protein